MPGSLPAFTERAFVDVGGVRTSLYTAGKPTAPTVLLLHDGAWGADALLCWGDVMADLARDHRVFAPDLPGFGQTDKVVMFGASPYEHRIRHVANLLAQLQVAGPVHAVGTSFGGSLALRAAIASAWPIASATSVAGTGGPWRMDVAKRLLADLDPGREYIARVVDVLANTTDGLADHIDRRYENSMAPGHYAAMVSPRLQHPAAPAVPFVDDFPASLASVSVPISIITMRQDQLVEPNWPRHVREVAPDVAFHEMDGPHSPNITRPAELAALLREVLADVEPAIPSGSRDTK